jgi:DNA-directed RNA polymerase specialized sigma24 family protein
MEFHQIYKEFYPKIFRYLSRLSGNNLEAEDLTQDVFIK